MQVQMLAQMQVLAKIFSLKSHLKYSITYFILSWGNIENLIMSWALWPKPEQAQKSEPVQALSLPEMTSVSSPTKLDFCLSSMSESKALMSLIGGKPAASWEAEGWLPEPTLTLFNEKNYRKTFFAAVSEKEKWKIVFLSLKNGCLSFFLVLWRF